MSLLVYRVDESYPLCVRTHEQVLTVCELMRAIEDDSHSAFESEYEWLLNGQELRKDTDLSHASNTLVVRLSKRRRLGCPEDTDVYQSGDWVTERLASLVDYSNDNGDDGDDSDDGVFSPIMPLPLPADAFARAAMDDSPYRKVRVTMRLGTLDQSAAPPPAVHTAIDAPPSRTASLDVQPLPRPPSRAASLDAQPRPASSGSRCTICRLAHRGCRHPGAPGHLELEPPRCGRSFADAAAEALRGHQRSASAISAHQNHSLADAADEAPAEATKGEAAKLKPTAEPAPEPSPAAARVDTAVAPMADRRHPPPPPRVPNPASLPSSAEVEDEPATTSAAAAVETDDAVKTDAATASAGGTTAASAAATPDAGSKIVWARLLGFPFWPAIVQRERRDGKLCVVFLATHDRAAVAREHVIRFDERPDWCEQRPRKRSLHARYKAAVAEARECLAVLTRGEALPPLPSSVHTEDEGEGGEGGEVGDEAPVDQLVDSSEDEEANDEAAPATAPLPLAPTAADVAVDMGARVGDRVEARDARGGWYIAKIVDARAGRSVDARGEAGAGAEVGAAPPAETQADVEAALPTARVPETARPYSELLVHFVGWKARWDEWVRVGEGRLRAIDDDRRAAEARGAVLAAAPAPAPASEEEDEAGEDEDEDEDEDEEMVSPGRAVDAEDSEGDDDADEGADVQTGHAAGNLVWARVPGFPAWPAVIERARAKHRALKPSAASLAPSLNADEGPGAGRPVFVRFLGARAQETFAWAAPGSVVSFGERLELCEQKLSKRSLRPRFKQAVAEAIRLLGAASADS